MKIVTGDRVFLKVPEHIPDWLQEAIPPTGSSGKADYITPQAVWVRWGDGHECWVPRSWLGGPP